jgi:hypothetical protein
MSRLHILILLAFIPSGVWAQITDRISLQFGEQALVVERSMVRRPVMNPPSREEWFKIERYEMGPGQMIEIYPLPDQIQHCASSFRSFSLKRRTVKINNYNINLRENRYPFSDIADRIESQFDFDKRLMPNTQRYEFRADDLRNAFGKQLRFVVFKLPDQTETTALLETQLTTEISMRITFVPHECFMSQGDKVVRQFRELILSRLK